MTKRYKTTMQLRRLRTKQLRTLTLLCGLLSTRSRHPQQLVKFRQSASSRLQDGPTSLLVQVLLLLACLLKLLEDDGLQAGLDVHHLGACGLRVLSVAWTVLGFLMSFRQL